MGEINQGGEDKKHAQTAVERAAALVEKVGVSLKDNGTKKKKATADRAAEQTEHRGKKNKIRSEMVQLANYIETLQNRLEDAPGDEKPEIEEALAEIKKILKDKETEAETVHAEAVSALGETEMEKAETLNIIHEDAATVNLERDPLAIYEGEVKLAKKAVDDWLQKIVDVWKEDDGFALGLTSDKSPTKYSIKDKELLGQIDAASTQAKEIQDRLKTRFLFFRGRLENQLTGLESQIEMLKDKLRKLRAKYENAYKNEAAIREKLSGYVGHYGHMIEQRNIAANSLSQEARKKYKDTYKTPVTKIEEEYPFIYISANRGITQRYVADIIDMEALFARFGYERKK